MPRAKLKELDGFLTTSSVASIFGLSPYLIKARIEDGTLPEASRVTDGGVLLFDDDWIDRARDVLSSVTLRKRRRRTSMTALVPSPHAFLGHTIGEAGWLPGWDQVVGYFTAVAEASDRVDVEVLGQSTEGRPYLVVAVSAPENLRAEARQRNQDSLGRLRDARLAEPEKVAPLIDEARTVGIILATQHSNEIGAMLMTMQLAFDLATADDQASLDILSNTLTLLVPSHNPDGVAMIAEWYERWLGTTHEGVEMPWLYHPYVGHDNNRDWFMQTQAETRTFVDLHNREHPQAVFDMHQMGRFGPRFMVPPFIDPLDPNQDPLIQQGFSALGSHIAQRLTAAGKAGVVTNAIFDNYSPSLAYGNYHGSVDLLSEAASAKLATIVTLEEEDLNADYGIDPRVRAWNQPLVWEAGTWSLADIVSYDLIAARAFLDHLARNRRQWLEDYAALASRASVRVEKPFAFVIPPDQRDPRAAAELLDILQRGLVEVHEATAPIDLDGIGFPAGTHVIRLDQPAGPFAKTLLEVQNYPELRISPDGPLLEPYDISGHTLPVQMGVQSFQIDRPLDNDLPLRLMSEPVSQHGHLVPTADPANAWAFDARSNAVSQAIQNLHGRGVPVFRARQDAASGDVHAGDALVAVDALREDELREVVARTGATARAVMVAAGTDVWVQSPVRLGVFKPWTASIDEGWARWVLEAYAYSYVSLTPADIRQGRLKDRIDVLLLPEMSARDIVEGRADKTREKDPYPPEYVGGLGDAGLDSIRRFIAEGGDLIAIDRAAGAMIDALSLPVERPLRDASSEEFSCPGSLLRMVIDTTQPLGYGMPRETAILFMNSLVFAGADKDVKVIGRYPRSNPRLSGWINGWEKMEGKAALVDAAYGNGRVLLVGFRPYFRAQSRGTYRILFNAIDRAGQSASTFP